VHGTAPRLSIVVPVGPGDRTWRALACDLEALSPGCELVLSAAEPPADDAGDIRVVCGPAGRAAQLNRGVAAANGDWLWLLHADSRPGAATLDAVAAFIAAHGDPDRPVLGWFELAFADDGPRRTALNARGANLRSRWLGLPFGDQGWLLSRRTFEHVGGFDPHFGRGEDLEFIVRARRAGVRLLPAGAALATSARRYRDRGWLRTTLAHTWFTLWLWLRARKRLRHRR
jgi:GT2 family glycosyltransferase